MLCNYISEAARIAEEGIATPAQVDKIVNDAIGGGEPLDLTRENELVVHCQQLMAEAPTGSDWFWAPQLLKDQGPKPWHDRKNPADNGHTEEQKQAVVDRILPVVFARTLFVADNDICALGDWNWLTRMSPSFKKIDRHFRRVCLSVESPRARSDRPN